MPVQRFILTLSNDQSTATGNEIVNRTGNSIKINLQSPIQLPQYNSDGKPQTWFVALRQLSIARVWPTIFEGLNDVIVFNAYSSITAVVGTYTITFQQGIYSLSALNKELQRLFVQEGIYIYAFQFKYDSSTNKTYVQISDQTVAILRSQSNLLTYSLGFDSVGPDLSSTIVGFQVAPNTQTTFAQEVKYLLVRCNLANSTLNDISTNVIGTVDISGSEVGVGSYVRYDSTYPLRAPIIGSSIQNIECDVVDQSLRDIDLTFGGDQANVQGLTIVLEISNE